jgi:hypothetical protein
MIDPECFGTSRAHIGRVKKMLKNYPAIEELIEDIKKILDGTLIKDPNLSIRAS